MVYNRTIQIKKLNLDTEKYEDYMTCHANINKASGREYFNANTEISSSTFNFRVRYSTALDDILYNTELYRIIYDGKIFNVKNVDNYLLKNHELTLVGEYHGK